MIKRVEIVVSSNAGAVNKDIDGLLARLTNLEKPRTIKIGIDGADAVRAELLSIKEMADGVSKKPFDLNFELDINKIATQLVALRLAATAAGMQAGKDFGASFDAAAAATMAGLKVTEQKVETAAAAAAGGAIGGKGGKGGGNEGGFLGSLLGTFGLGPKGRAGIFGTIPLFGGIGAISGLHLIAQGAIEIAATLIPATIAMAAFGIAGSDAAVTIYNHFTDLHTVMDATGKSIYPMTGAMEALHKAAAPEVFQVLGDAISVMNHKGGEFEQVALGAGHALDQLFARATVAIDSSGMGVFMHNAVQDLYKWGTLIGNIFGIVGNLLRALPGYANIILNVLVDATHDLEVLTSQAPIQWAVHLGLAFHGAAVYLGILGSGALLAIPRIAKLINAFAGADGASHALRDLGTAASNIQKDSGKVSFFDKIKAGLQDISNNTPIVAGRIRGVDAAAEEGAQKISLMSRAGQLFTSGLKWGVVIGALIGTVSEVSGAISGFHTLNNATEAWVNTLQSGVQNGPIQNLLPQIHQDIGAIELAMKSASKSFIVPHYGFSFANLFNGKGIVEGWDNMVQHWGIGVSKFGELNAALHQFQTEGQQVSKYVMDPLSKQFGGTAQAMDVLSHAGITSKQALDAAAAAAHGNLAPLLALKQQVQGTVLAYKAMGAQSGALGNDLQVLDRQATDQYKAAQTLNQGWDAFIQNVTGTQGTFDTFASGMRTLDQAGAAATRGMKASALAAHGYGAELDSLKPKGIALNQAFTQQVTNANGLIDTWRQAGVAGNYFSEGVKGSVAELLKFAKGSPEALDQLVALAQEAGYKGPAAFSDLVKWVGNTHDALLHMKEAANQATQQEALLSGSMRSQGEYISNQLIGDINQATLKYYGVQKAAEAYGNAIAKDGQQSQAAHSARQTLINDIIESGKAAHETTNQIAAMIAKVLHIPLSRAIRIVEQGTGHFEISGGYGGTQIRGPYTHRSAQGGGPSGAHGLFVNQGTTPTADDVLARVSRGELIVPAHMVTAGAVDHLRGRIPGFAAGGMANPSMGFNFGTAAVNYNQNFIGQFTSSMESAMKRATQTAIHAAMMMTYHGGGPSGGSALAAANYARSLLGRYGWGNQWGALNYVAMRESGWSMIARNPSSGAYGIAQFINGPSEYYQYGGNPNTIAGQVIAFLNYIRQRYGSPSAAAAHEAAYNWYGGGLRNGMFTKPTIIGVGESGPELVNVTPMRSNAARYAAGSMGGDCYYITVQGDTDPDAAARRIHQNLRRLKKHRGNQPLGLD